MSKVEEASEDRLCRSCGKPHEFKSNYCDECGPNGAALKHSHVNCQEEFQELTELIDIADEISESFKRMSDKYRQALDTMRARRSRNK